MAASERFNRALGKLLGVFRSYSDTPRTPESVPELASRRLELESARSDIAAQRELDGLPTATPRRSPRWVDPSIGGRPARPFEIGAAIVAIAIIVGAGLWFWWSFFVSDSDSAVELVEGSVVETLEENQSGSCTWTVDFVLSADAAEAVTVTTDVHIDRVAPVRRNGAASIVPRGHVSGTVPGRLVYEFPICPESMDDIDHGPLVITYDQPGEPPRSVRLGW